MHLAKKLVLLVVVALGVSAMAASAASAVIVTPTGTISGTSTATVLDGDFGFIVISCTSASFAGSIQSSGAGTINGINISGCTDATGTPCNINVDPTTGTFTITSTVAFTFTADTVITFNFTCAGTTFTCNADTTVTAVVTDNTAGTAGSGLTFNTEFTCPLFTDTQFLATFRVVDSTDGATLTIS
jgi:hypothetical protein